MVDGRAVAYVTIVRGVAPGPTLNGPADHLTVGFSFPVGAATFTAADLSLTRDGGENLFAEATGVTVTQLSDTRFRIDGLSAFTAAGGDYVLTVFAVRVRRPAAPRAARRGR